MAQDLAWGVEFVSHFEGRSRGGEIRSEDLVLIGHSAGGGLSQYFLSEKMGKVGGLVILTGIPCFGA
jgi:alpha-beta hydrolase superfamily lysophospholipase